MIHSWMEEMFDTFFYIGTVVGFLIFFLCYWNENYQRRCAELIVQEFLDEVSAGGIISLELYEYLVQSINKINTSYEVEVSYSTYNEEPVYAKIPEGKIREYYLNRNIRKNIVLQEVVKENDTMSVETLRLQKETNASLLAAENGGCISLPEDGGVFRIEAVRAIQKVYEGEELLTLCRVISEDGNYYVEAEKCYGTVSGRVNLKVWIGTEYREVPVEVVCYPRIVCCENGHEMANTDDVFRAVQSGEEPRCSLCREVPKELTLSTSILPRKTGTKLTGEELWINAVYQDGSWKQIYPENQEWQDNYDENFCGIQSVVIRYRNAEATLLVLSENDSCMQCGKECNDRSYGDYIKFPYCVVCMSQMALFTGNTVQEETIVSDKEIVSMLDNVQKLVLNFGDTVKVRILKNRRQCSLLYKIVKCKER